jgi:hypothetical protein
LCGRCRLSFFDGVGQVGDQSRQVIHLILHHVSILGWFDIFCCFYDFLCYCSDSRRVPEPIDDVVEAIERIGQKCPQFVVARPDFRQGV